jgi:hypothetical protein
MVERHLPDFPPEQRTELPYEQIHQAAFLTAEDV